jgi:hypothetical protein
MEYVRPGEPGSIVEVASRYENYIGGEWKAPRRGRYRTNLARRPRSRSARCPDRHPGDGPPDAKLDIPPIPEFVEMIADAGAGLYGCKASVDLFGLTDTDLIPQFKGVIAVGEFYELAAGG